MTAVTRLHDWLTAAAARDPDRIAVEDPGRLRRITYGALAASAARLRDRLIAAGVAPGDRVGIYLAKSIESIVAMFAISCAGAAYVPVDPLAPAVRNALILADCAVAAVIVEPGFAGGLATAWTGAPPPMLDPRAPEPRPPEPSPPPPAADPRSADDLAYVLYTSGSTGRPKGVMLSHANAIAFVDWCSSVLAPRADDRFSSHAPLHFDLSILDVFVAIKHGATVVLIGEAVGKQAQALGPLIADHRITIWYSAPSILSLLAELGGLDALDLSALRLVLFAGEVFPIRQLRRLQQLVPGPRYLNLYGPTETNVCTYHEVPAAIDAARTTAMPIGRVCAHLRARVLDLDGQPVARGSQGELVIAGANVMRGYWNLAERTAAAFVMLDGARWYRTGDLVVEDAAGDYVFVGRRDRMIKKRGYRIELGEIEARLQLHPAVREVAVVAVTDDDHGVRIKAFVACRGERRPSMIELKRFCLAALPAYMAPDLFAYWPALPRTSTDKTDYARLAAVPPAEPPTDDRSPLP